MPMTNCTVGDGIVEFGIGPFYNASGCSSDFGIAGYGDYTSLTVPVGQGNVESVLLRSDFANQQFSIWIDMDNSDSFESSELILTDIPVGIDLVTTTVTIPATLPFGDYIMRVQATYAGPSSTDPCFVGTYGETEDYTVNVGPPPTCIMVTDIAFSGISSNSVNVTWTDAGTGSVWDIEYGLSGFIPTGTPSAGFDNVTNPVMISGLSPITEYDVYIRSDCAGDNITDVSYWSAPNSFTTECASLVPYYLQDFNAFPFGCWEVGNGGDLSTGPTDNTFSNWFDNGFANFGFTGAQSVWYFGGFDQSNWLITPFFDLTGGTYQAEFDLAITEPFNQSAVTLGSDDAIAFAVSGDLGATWNIIQWWDSASVVTASGEHLIYDLSAYTGTDVKFAFWASNGALDDFVQFQTHIDNFIIQDLGSPMGSQVDQTIDLNCGGDSTGVVLISVNGGTPPYSFLWDDGSTNEDLTGAFAGEHYVTITDGIGIIFMSDTVELFEPAPIIIDAVITDESVNGANDGAIDITVTGGTGPYNFLWNNGSSDEDISGLIDALWCVTATDVFGCQVETCFTVMAGPTGHYTIENLSLFKIFPNPVSENTLNVEMVFAENKSLELSLLNSLGQELNSRKLTNVTHSKETLDMNVAKGVYILRLTDLNTGEQSYKKVVRE